MAKSAYLPDSDGGKATWLITFSQKINEPGVNFPTAGEDHGLTAAEVAQVPLDSTMFNFCIQNQDSFQNEREQRTDYKNLVRDGAEGVAMNAYPTSVVVAPPAAVPQGVFKRIPDLVARIKASAAYSTEIGEDWGIIGDEQAFDPNTLKPLLELVLLGNGVLVQWKKDVATGIQIHVDRGNGYQFLAMDTQPNYLDTFPMPAEAATWKYKAVYEIADEPVGIFSDEVEIQVVAQV